LNSIRKLYHKVLKEETTMFSDDDDTGEQERLFCNECEKDMEGHMLLCPHCEYCHECGSDPDTPPTFYCHICNRADTESENVFWNEDIS
jgi:hypothetical protein